MAHLLSVCIPLDKVSLFPISIPLKDLPLKVGMLLWHGYENYADCRCYVVLIDSVSYPSTL